MISDKVFDQIKNIEIMKEAVDQNLKRDQMIRQM
jgi:hypothetical protein